jgi:lysophospholipase L1-like esterase
VNRLLKGLLAGTAALALTATAAAPASAGPLTPNRDRYAAVGDSYAAGVGNPTLKNSGTSLRSADAYPVLLAGKTNKVTFLAATGATTLTVAASQVPYVPPTAQQVTVTVGGNDIGFATVALTCASNPGACGAAIGQAQANLAALPGTLGPLLGALTQAAPDAQIYVTGYPRLFQPGATCAAFPSTPIATLAAADAAVDALNGTLQFIASSSGAVFVDVNTEFAGHGLCGDDSYIFPPTPIAEPPYFAPASLHPNALGQAAYAEAVDATAFTSAQE